MDQFKSRKADWFDDSAECASEGGQSDQVIEENEAAMPGLN
jgi:hypothetical protein